MTTNRTPQPSAIATIGFISLAVLMPPVVCAAQWVGWFGNQLALSSLSFGQFAVLDILSLPAEVLMVSAVAGLFLWLSPPAFKPAYQSWLTAGLLALPAILLRFLGPNQDQLGALLQILLAGGAALALWIIRRPKRPSLGGSGTATGLALVPLAVWPFVLWGAAGSGADLLLDLLAALALGTLAAALIPATSGNKLLDGLAIGGLLTILGSAFGYDGSQLILMAVLPPLGLAIASLDGSAVGAFLMIGLVAAAPMCLVDPMELAIVLGDLGPWMLRAGTIAIILGLIVSGVAWGLSRFRLVIRPGLAIAGGGMLWLGLMCMYALRGQHGFYGDRLFVILKDQADVSKAYAIADLPERRTFVYQTLVSSAQRSQADLKLVLHRLHIQYTSYYLVNAVELDGGLLTRLYLMTRPDVARVLDSPRLRPLPEAATVDSTSAQSATDNPGWNVTMVGADKVWGEFGAIGQGVVVGQSDTGVDGRHPALAAAYRGIGQGNDYNWYDPWNHTAAPVDAEGHGTHTLGSILGSTGIGIAPGAKWIACVNLARDLGNPALYLNCLQFHLAPFPQGGDPFKNGDPALAADVLNNSWGCPPLEGCDADVMNPAAKALRAAGIFVVVSAGNDGPNCATVSDPLALYDSVLSVGAVDSNGQIADFSSRGPVTIDGSNRLKPDIVAPGVDVVSSWPGGGYMPESGTSMAGPQVVGAVALLWSARPALKGNIDETTRLIESTARMAAYSDASSCGGAGAARQNVYGHGILDVYAAVKAALGK